MKGVKCIKSLKLSTILVVLFALFFTLLNVNSVFAITKDYSGFKLRLRYEGANSYVLTNNLAYNEEVYDVDRVDGVRIEVNNVGSVPSDTNFVSVTGKVNLVVRCNGSYIMTTNGVDADADVQCPHNTGDPPHIDAVAVNGVSSTFISSNINTYITNWMVDRTYPYVDELFRTFTYEYTFIISNNIPSNITSLAFFFTYDGSLDNATRDSYMYYFEGDPNNKMLIDFTIDHNTAILLQQTQLQNLANEYLQQIAQQTQQDQQDREDLQVQSDESSDAADDAGADIANGGQRLLDVITTFYGLFISPPQKDCKVSMGTLFNAYHSGTYADADLCSLSPPPAFSIIATLIMIGATIPFAVSVINTLIKIMEGVLTT